MDYLALGMWAKRRSYVIGNLGRWALEELDVECRQSLPSSLRPFCWSIGVLFTMYKHGQPATVR